ncbi:MSMEG_0570 family nitrogen starvation response protein [Acinetobacter sp. NCu2D-2]|uniref:MSMEG_0570 family nitrogen starvation response protein n=1 Tax=Acinetobacter sp. NCu2D-2 TaxID=1608473 RepID=UPI001F3E1D27|nr:MSMEG_0570 family nitrogen starvation response protein [Acinetobacter sp. NCu2D-2]
MPSVNFTVKWPNGQHDNFYSPSTIVYEYFQKGQKMLGNEFLNQVDNALHAASERVRARYGFACSSAMDTLNRIQIKAQHMAIQPTDYIEITDIYNID